MIKLVQFVLVTLIIAGCAQQIPRANPSTVEFVVSSKSANSRRFELGILLDAGGAARVDIADRADVFRPLRTYILPASASEIQRLCRLLATVDEHALSNPLHYEEMGLEDSKDLLIACRIDASTRSIALSSHQRALSYPVKGILDEIEFIGNLRLAKAIDFYKAGNYFLSLRKIEAAIREYNVATNSLDMWYGDRCSRYQIFDEEPAHRDADVGRFFLTLSAAAFQKIETKKQAGEVVTDLALIDALTSTWRDWSAMTSSELRGDVTIVSFSNALMKLDLERSGATNAVPNEVVERLMRWNWRSLPPGRAVTH